MNRTMVAIGAVLTALVLTPVLIMGAAMLTLITVLGGSQSSNPCVYTPAPSGSWVQPTIDADGRIGSPFGQRFHPILKIWRMHNGVDLGNQRGTPIWSVSNGVVVSAVDGCSEGVGSCNGGAGNTVVVDHGDGVVTKYLHLLTGSINVKAGQQVAAGQQIGTMGSTGLSTAPHLHFGIQVNGTYLDPDLFMRERGVNIATTEPPLGRTPSADALSNTTPSSPLPTPGGDVPAQLVSRTSGGTEIKLTREQLQEASITIGVGQSLGISQRGLQVALVTELQESALGAHPSTRSPDANGDVGTFQQRSLPGWYGPGQTQTENVAWLNVSQNAATVFFTGQKVTAETWAAAQRAGVTPAGPVGYQVPGLLDINGWESLPVGEAAQRVQRSAFPDAYSRWEPVAADILATVSGVRPDGRCGDSDYGKVYPPGDMPQSERWVGSEARLTPTAIIAKRAVAAVFPEITTIGGWRASSKIATSDHPAGKAIDVMISNYNDPAQIALGDRVADFLIANHVQLKVKYVIWRQRIWTPNNPNWRPMEDRGSPVDNHYDHIHLSVLE